LIKPAIQGFLGLLAHFPLRFQYRFADLVVFVICAVPNRFSRQMQQNIGLCFPELDQAAQKRLYRQALRHTVYAFFELAAVWYWPAEKILPWITTLDICEEFQRTTRGKIILVPHLGSWELLGIWLGQHCGAIILYKRLKNKVLDGYIRQVRGRTGGSPVPTRKHGLRKLLVGLRANGTLMILPDQKPGGGKARINSEIFGIDAPTTTLVRSLCNKVDCDVFIATIYRSAPPGEFGLIIQPLDHDQLAHDEATSARYMNNKIEQLVRQFPEQYQWSYRRFSNRAYGPAK